MESSPIEAAKLLLTSCEQTDLLVLFNSFNGEKQLKLAECLIKLDKVTPTGMEQYF
jgi:hypothetical protein